MSRFFGFLELLLGEAMCGFLVMVATLSAFVGLCISIGAWACLIIAQELPNYGESALAGGVSAIILGTLFVVVMGIRMVIKHTIQAWRRSAKQPKEGS